jgi:hypothetical protein
MALHLPVYDGSTSQKSNRLIWADTTRLTPKLVGLVFRSSWRGRFCGSLFYSIPGGNLAVRASNEKTLLTIAAMLIS